MNIMREIDFQRVEPERLAAIEARLAADSLMTAPERLFVNGLLRHFKPRKILEVGIWTGTGSALILNAIADRPESRLISIDLLSVIPRDHPQNGGGGR